VTEGLVQLGVSGRVERQVAYSSDLDRLLSLGSERRGEKAASQRPEGHSSVHYQASSGHIV